MIISRFGHLWHWFILLAILQYIFQIIAVVHLVQTEKIHGQKWVWVLVILLGETLGPIVYFIFGPDRNK
jgi:hypothetical protein